MKAACLPTPTWQISVLERYLLKRFDCTDEDEVVQYLGCEVIFDREGGKVMLCQNLKVYAPAERVLRAYVTVWGCAPWRQDSARAGNESKADSPKQIDPALQRRYRGMVGHISFLVSCTSPNLAFKA
eukprot:1465652-Rhodomonas_salina.1